MKKKEKENESRKKEKKEVIEEEKCKPEQGKKRIFFLIFSIHNFSLKEKNNFLEEKFQK